MNVGKPGKRPFTKLEFPHPALNHAVNQDEPVVKTSGSSCCFRAVLVSLWNSWRGFVTIPRHFCSDSYSIQFAGQT